MRPASKPFLTTSSTAFFDRKMRITLHNQCFRRFGGILFRCGFAVEKASATGFANSAKQALGLIALTLKEISSQSACCTDANLFRSRVSYALRPWLISRSAPTGRPNHCIDDGPEQTEEK